MKKEFYLQQKGVIHMTPMYCKDLSEAIFLAKLMEPMEKTTVRIYEGESLDSEHNKLLWRSEDAKDYPFGCEETLKKAKIIETYDNAVDLEVYTAGGRYIIGVFCYYDQEECKRPIAGEIDYDYDDGNVTLSFTDSEKAVIQSILDKQEFKQFQFGMDFIPPMENPKENELDER